MKKLAIILIICASALIIQSCSAESILSGENKKESTDLRNLQSTYNEAVVYRETNEFSGEYKLIVYPQQEKDGWENESVVGQTVGDMTVGNGEGELNAVTKGGSWVINLSGDTGEITVSAG